MSANEKLVGRLEAYRRRAVNVGSEDDQLLGDLLRALQPASDVGAQSDWKLVPVKATPEMLAITRNVVSAYAAERIWEAMLTAAPPAVAQEPRYWMTKEGLEQVVSEIVLSVAEIPDRNSPDDQPEMMLVTDRELRNIVRGSLEELPFGAAPSPAEPREPIGHVWHALANDGISGHVVWYKSVAMLPDNTPIYAGTPPQCASMEELPTDWVEVPREPTDEMLYMMYRAFNNKAEKIDSYTQMLSAAPTRNNYEQEKK